MSVDKECLVSLVGLDIDSHLRNVFILKFSVFFLFYEKNDTQISLYV